MDRVMDAEFEATTTQLPPHHSDAPSPVALSLSQLGINLPSSPTLTTAQVSRNSATLRDLLYHG